ncbi:MAG TPA: transcription elongation factor GreA [bacterium]
MKQTYLTREGLKKLQGEQQALLRQKRELTEEVSAAAAMGDLRENAEYHAARERLQHVASRIAELDGKLQHVVLIDDLDIKDGEARVGTTVTLHEERAKEEFSYQLVGPDEADPVSGKLSIASPLGKALLGKTEGERVSVTLPNGMAAYRVVRIERTPS